MTNEQIILLMKKSCVVLHALAFSLKDENSHKETLLLVDGISEGIKIIETKRNA